MRERALSAALMLVLVFGMSSSSSAKPPKTVTHRCKCTCVVIDENGKLREGDSISFTTTSDDCSVGSKTGCYVGDVKGSYGSCTGTNISSSTTKNTEGVGTVSEPTGNIPSTKGRVPVVPVGGAVKPK